MTGFFERHDPILGILFAIGIGVFSILVYFTRIGIDIAIQYGYTDFVLWMASITTVCTMFLILEKVRP